MYCFQQNAPPPPFWPSLKKNDCGLLPENYCEVSPYSLPPPKKNTARCQKQQSRENYSVIAAGGCALFALPHATNYTTHNTTSGSASCSLAARTQTVRHCSAQNWPCSPASRLASKTGSCSSTGQGSERASQKEKQLRKYSSENLQFCVGMNTKVKLGGGQKQSPANFPAQDPSEP